MKKGVKVLYYLATCFLLAVFLFSGYRVMKYVLDGRSAVRQNDKLIEQAVVVLPQSETELLAGTEPPVHTDPAVEESEQQGDKPNLPEQVELPKDNTPAQSGPLSVDFDALQKESKDIVGWIYSPDTPINYPVVQGDDNEYYLHRMYNGWRVFSGSIFMDYRNSGDCSDWNTIIYGHNLNNGTMFSTLERYVRQSYYEIHPVLYLYTPDREYEVLLIAGFTTDVYSDVFTNPESMQERDELVELCLSVSDFKADVEVCADDRLVTLATCTDADDETRHVVVGVLREME